MSLERFRSVLAPERYAELEQGVAEALELLAGSVVWNINSTARGGGVAELLESLVAYGRGAGVDTRWVVVEGTPEFFELTKRIHNRLHGAAGDGGPLDERAHRVYEETLERDVQKVVAQVHEGDVVIVHDPQPAGLVGPLRAAGASVIWRCHVGLDRPNDHAREAWEFLRKYVAEADAWVFSRESFVWEGLDRDRIELIAPSIDVFSPKNQDLEPETVRAVLEASGIVHVEPVKPAGFRRSDGTPGRVDRRAEVFEDEPLKADSPVVLQVSRWDALKDPVGVIRGFAEHVPLELGAHLVYAGPSIAAVADDPEGGRVLREAMALREGLPAETRARVHLASLPMEDPEENATIVNALQRHAHVIVQKSIAEGFGLTVAEAMWKGRPVLATRIGGIQDQIIDGESGVLLDDPNDLEAYGVALARLLGDNARAGQIGERARERVRDQFTSPRSLLDYLRVIRRVRPARDA